jgi:hypothetical protein
MSDIFDQQEDATARRSLTLGALLLILDPFFQAGTQIFPLQLNNIQWRFNAANALSSVLILPYVGFTLLLAISRATESRGMSRLIGVVSVLMTLGLLAAMAVFALDALQLKTIVSTQMETAFKMTSVRVSVVCILHVIAFLALALAGFRGAPGDSPRTRRASAGRTEDASSGLIVGR